MDMTTKEGMIEYTKGVAKTNKWILNTDKQTFSDLIEGLVDNKKKYGYQSCPCRLASGKKDLDRDIICPCTYAAPDVKEFGACYCNLYMRADYYQKIKKSFVIVPERRPIQKEKAVLEYINSQIK
jgi:ferredoxin-thioredoxin reductase catalytic subunit